MVIDAEFIGENASRDALPGSNPGNGNFRFLARKGNSESQVPLEVRSRW